MMSLHTSAKPVTTNPDCKNGWDRRPLGCETWKMGVPAAARKTLDFVARALESARSRAA